MKLFGPVQEYDAPVTVGVLSDKVLPAHIGPLLPAIGVEGKGLTFTTLMPLAQVAAPQFGEPVVVTIQAYVLVEVRPVGE